MAKKKAMEVARRSKIDSNTVKRLLFLGFGGTGDGCGVGAVAIGG